MPYYTGNLPGESYRTGSLRTYPVMLTALGDAITDFDVKLVGTPKYRGEQKAAKQNMDIYFAQAADIVKNKLDVLAEIIKDTNPETYVEYKNTRKNENKTYPTSFDLWNEFRLGYVFDFKIKNLSLFLNLQIPLGFALYSDPKGKSEAFKQNAKENPLFYIPLFFIGIRF